ncbi:MAG TPA: PspA/IM30 family protein [Solimonas sp.]
MASLIARIRELVTAHAHHSLDLAENPDVMAQQVLRDLSEDIQAAQRALVTALGAEKSLARSRAQFLAEGADWERKAEQLLRAGNDDLARGALERAVAARRRAEEQEAPLETAQRSVSHLREQVEQLKREWESARARAAQINANQAAATALGVASQGGDHYSRAMDRAQRLDQLSRKAARFESEVEAATELLNEQTRFDRAAAQADQAAAVDTAFAALQQRVAASPASA